MNTKRECGSATTRSLFFTLINSFSKNGLWKSDLLSQSLHQNPVFLLGCLALFVFPYLAFFYGLILLEPFPMAPINRVGQGCKILTQSVLIAFRRA